jgi:hypothetical protein
MTHALNEAARSVAREIVEQAAGEPASLLILLELAFKRGAVWGAHDRGAVDALVSDDEVNDLIEHREDYEP